MDLILYYLGQKCQWFFLLFLHFYTHICEDGASQCRRNWQQYGTSCYYLNNNALTWPNAQRYCASQGGNLVSIADTSVNSDVRNLLNGGSKAHIGEFYEPEWMGGGGGGSLWLGIDIYTTIKTKDVCVSCLCRPPSDWWISFIFYTIIGLDPEGGQWLFKLQSYNNNKNYRRNRAKYPGHRYTRQNSICGTVVKYRSTYPINMTWRRVCCVCIQLLLFDCVSPSVQCQIYDTGYCRWFWKWNGQCSASDVSGHENELGSAVKWVLSRYEISKIDFKLSCIASRRANISWAIRSSSLEL